ncbi:uncharacterized protein LOC122080780 [Macadamia integrifolia]|uniref:uncharacterized protein LOC122080780 n=1 Tax=Macadamia integrifolia TaxID=60698 RepID=UPI001C4E3BFF|nr:uncharacterized protein LOC122080780 [Macadamia integrifolia]XP_042503564.1 uncharacterized protein LOC122080780 [Macadamia integrifolia]
MRDLESVFRSEGREPPFPKSSMIKEVTDQFLLGKREERSPITQEPVTKISDNFQTIETGRNSLSISEDATRLSLGHIGYPPRSMDLNAEPCIPKDSDHDDAPANVVGICKPSMVIKQVADHDTNFTTSRGNGLDLNAEDVSSSMYHDQVFPYKSQKHLKSRDVSECGSSTGPLDEKDSLRVWREMKQNGFFSSTHGGMSSHGGIPMPKQRGRKSKNDTLKKKMELAKREQVNRFTKIAAPSGLLNELNPGIINHVRNSKQVHSIIEALVRSEKLENGQSRSANNLKRGTKETNDRRKDMENMHDSGTSQHNVSHGNEPGGQTPMFSTKVAIPLNSDHMLAGNLYFGARRVSDKSSGASHITSDCEHETIGLKLSSENTSSVSNEESENQATVSSLSVKAATVASQWLELLHDDIRGRLAALRRSKKRVRAVIQTELPFLLSKEFKSNQENDPNVSCATECSKPHDIANPEMHQAKWTALFDQMEKALSEEGRHLESWLNQVTEMQLHCARGLQSINWFTGHGLPQVGRSENESRLKNMDNSDRELAIRAAAASIYSTCNYAMSTENVSCF